MSEPGEAQLVAHYRLVRKLGEGGMGEVFEAVDERIDRRVALKLLTDLATSTDRQARFVREAKAAGALNHPGIVTLYDIGMANGQLYLAMELLEGRALYEVAQQGVAPTRALTMVAEAADALAAAHARGILHRDIKSDNLMLTSDGRVKVLDFGLAKLHADGPVSIDDHASLEAVTAPSRSAPPAPPSAPPRPGKALDGGGLSEAKTVIASPKGRPSTLAPAAAAAGTPMPPPRALTRAGSILGTPGFMAPEQTLGQPVDEKCEVFALGVVLYELLARRRPFDRVSLEATLEATRTASAPPPSQRQPAVTPTMDAVVARALDKEPARRYPDMASFATALRAAAAEPARVAAARQRRRVQLGAGAFALLALAGGAVWWRLSRSAAVPQPVVTQSRRLTFDPGCEEYPAFTPDGQRVVYDGLWDGDYEVIALEPASGRKVRLTHSPSWDYSAVVSPDGKQVAYIHQGAEEEVRVGSLEGDEVSPPVTLGRSWGLPAWTRSGDVLVGTDRELVGWTGGKPEGRHVVARLPEGLQANALAPMQGGEVVMVLGNFAQDAPPELWRMKRDHSFSALKVEASQYGLGAAPRGDAFYHLRRSASGGDELVRRRRDGSAPRVVQGGLAPAGGFAIASDRKRMVYSNCKSKSSLARLRAGGVDLVGEAAAWQDSAPVLAGTRVLFTSDRSGIEQLWMQERAGGQATLLGAGYRPAVSPDGAWVAYSARTEPGLHVMPMAGGPALRLTDQVSDTGASFTHDGASLVFVRTTDQGDRLMIVPRGGGAVRELVSGVTVSVAAASPSVDQIVYLRSDGDNVGVMLTDAAGTAPRQLGAAMPRAYYAGLKFSVDGKRLLVIRSETEVVELPLDGGVPVVLWRASTEALGAVDMTADGELWASITRWDGDLWLAEGRFP
ncbi:MAG: serine/threonine-protein kinase [Deltaproteobacteria bacterium]|nr:serine/threonine-protein kinase [Deltaproteobacteria bacterium]